eukprot:3375663-Pyramimonas_sp.AAC.1
MPITSTPMPTGDADAGWSGGVRSDAARGAARGVRRVAAEGAPTSDEGRVYIPTGRTTQMRGEGIYLQGGPIR